MDLLFLQNKRPLRFVQILSAYLRRSPGSILSLSRGNTPFDKKNLIEYGSGLLKIVLLCLTGIK